ncbi:unnamed protein product, partial [Ranitomeya imitator]
PHTTAVTRTIWTEQAAVRTARDVTFVRRFLEGPRRRLSREGQKHVREDGAPWPDSYRENRRPVCGMKYMPEADQNYANKITGDTGKLPDKFCGLYSLEKFYEDPKCSDGNAYRMQIWMYSMRMLQYSDALDHLLSTGQGVVLERSAFSDYVFLDAMYKSKYIRKECVNHYNEIKKVSIDEFLPPHIVIYVDVPAADVYKKIQDRGNTIEKKVELSYLQNIEDVYKTSFLPQIGETSEVLQYSSAQSENVEQKLIVPVSYQVNIFPERFPKQRRREDHKKSAEYSPRGEYEKTHFTIVKPGLYIKDCFKSPYHMSINE